MPVQLPPILRAFLRTQPFALLTIGSTDGTILIAKIPGADIESCQGRQKIHVRYELHSSQTGPALRLVLTIHDRPGEPLFLETFFNPADDVQMADFADLVAREHLRILFYDEKLKHRLSKKVPQPTNASLDLLVPEAMRLLTETYGFNFNFDQTKADIMASYPLDPLGEKE
jgi:hypothetical protein